MHSIGVALSSRKRSISPASSATAIAPSVRAAAPAGHSPAGGGTDTGCKTTGEAGAGITGVTGVTGGKGGTPCAVTGGTSGMACTPCTGTGAPGDRGICIAPGIIDGTGGGGTGIGAPAAAGYPQPPAGYCAGAAGRGTKVRSAASHHAAYSASSKTKASFAQTWCPMSTSVSSHPATSPITSSNIMLGKPTV